MTNTVSISTTNIKTRFQKNNTKNTSLKHESIADLSDSTFETINQGRNKITHRPNPIHPYKFQ